MSITFTSAWRAESIKRELGVSAPAALEARLFVNDKSPAAGDVLANYTEASGGGYAAITLDGPGWTVTPGSPATATRSEGWTFTGPLDGNAVAYGVYFTSNGMLVGAERFAAPQPITGAQTPVSLDPLTFSRA